MNKWVKYKLSEITTFASGGTPSKKKKQYWEGNIPWISALSMSTNKISSSELKITEDGLSAGSRLAKKDSILLLVRGGALHKRIPVGIALNDVAFNQDVKSITVNKNVLEPLFLLYWFEGHKHLLLNKVENTGIGAGKLDTKILNNLVINVPPKAIRSKIISIIKSIDDKIELNNQINQTLEAMAHALFKSWFVDFEPVKAKIEANADGADAEGVTLAAMEAISGQNAEALAKLAQTDPERYAELKTTAELFPDALMESELGEIPAGWSLNNIGTIAKNIRKGVHPDDVPETTPYIGLEHIDKKVNYVSRWGKAKDVDSQKSSFKSNDVLFGKLRPYFHKVVKVNFDGICSTDILVLRTLDDKYDSYLQHFVFQESFINYVNQRATGTRMPRAKWKDMAEHKIVLPTAEILYKFNSFINVFNKKCSLNISQSKQLETLRDTLLPKLLSGEVSVEDV